MLSGDVLHVTEPVVDQAERLGLVRRAHAAAAVMADDDDVLDIEGLDRVLEHGEAIQVGVHDDVGDIAVDEELARCEAGDLVGRHPAVGAADPQIARLLLLGELGEVIRIARAQIGSPGVVSLEQVLERRHRGTTPDWSAS